MFHRIQSAGTPRWHLPSLRKSMNLKEISGALYSGPDIADFEEKYNKGLQSRRPMSEEECDEQDNSYNLPQSPRSKSFREEKIQSLSSEISLEFRKPDFFWYVLKGKKKKSFKQRREFENYDEIPC